MDEFIKEQIEHLNNGLPNYKTVDLGFWDKNGQYKEDKQIINWEKDI